jgi:hypothetical protein
MSQSTDRLLAQVRTSGLLRSQDLVALGIARVTLTRAVRRGQLERVGRGLYGLVGRPVSADHSLAMVARRVPKGVICLLSALQLHELTTQLPYQVWLAIDNKAAPPKLDYPPLRLVRFSGSALTAGVDGEPFASPEAQQSSLQGAAVHARSMTVGDLKALLEQFPPDAPVIVEGYETGWDGVHSVQDALVVPRQSAEDWDGEFQSVKDAEGANVPSTLAVQIIGRRGHRRCQSVAWRSAPGRVKSS